MNRKSSYFSRRAVLAAPMVYAAGNAVSQNADVDIVIIGAGAAGLSAARTAAALGLSYLVIEARQRIGGRVLTDRSLGVPVDGGATFIHFADKNPWTKIAEQTGIETCIGNWREGGYREFADGQPRQSETAFGMGPGRSRLWAMMDDIEPENDVSFAGLVKDAPPEVVAAGYAMARGAVGEEPDRVSVADYNRLYDGINRVVPAGYGTLVEQFGAGVPVRLGVEAKAVNWRGNDVTISTSQGDISARTAIITVPLGVLKAEKIAFSPPLPNETLRALDGMAMGALTKIVLKFSGNRFGAATNMQYVALPGAKPGVSFEMWPFDREVVVGWIGGDYAREVTGLGEEAAVQHMLARFREIVGPEADKAFINGRLFGWAGDPHALGSYSYAKVGHAPARDVLRHPIDGKLWFAGEMCAGRASMTVAGAYQTGEQAVHSIATKLKGRRG